MKHKRIRRTKCAVPPCEQTAPGGRIHCAAHRREFKALDDAAVDSGSIRQAMRDLGIPVRRIRIQPELPWGFQFV